MTEVWGVGEPWATSLLGRELREKERSKKGEEAFPSPFLTSILLHSASSPAPEVPGGAHGHASPPMGLRAEQCRSSQRTVPNQGLPAAPHPPAPPTHIPLCHGSTRRGGGDGEGGTTGSAGWVGVGGGGLWGAMGVQIRTRLW